MCEYHECDEDYKYYKYNSLYSIIEENEEEDEKSMMFNYNDNDDQINDKMNNLIKNVIEPANYDMIDEILECYQESYIKLPIKNNDYIKLKSQWSKQIDEIKPKQNVWEKLIDKIKF